MSLSGNTILPLSIDVERIETRAVLRKEALAELKGFVTVIPNQNILTNAIVLREAKESSAIENIITTHDELKACSKDRNVCYRINCQFYRFHRPISVFSLQKNQQRVG